MKLITSFLSICITLLFIQCKSALFVTNPEFTITSATYHSWTGGQPGVGGTNVKITLENTDKIDFDSIYFRGQQTKVELKSTKEKTTLLAYFPDKNKTIPDLILDKNPIKELKNTLPEKQITFPFELEKDEVVISYTFKEKTKYFKTSATKKKTKQFQ